MHRQARVSVSICGVLLFALLLTLNVSTVSPGQPGGSAALAGSDMAWEEEYILDWDELIVDISAVDDGTAWCVGTRFLDEGRGESTILKTTDAGTDWECLDPGPAQPLLSIAAVDANTAWAAGEGTIIKTVNGGGDWLPQELGAPYLFTGISAVDENVAWAVGGYTEALPPYKHHSAVLRTTTGGEDWYIVCELEDFALFDIVAIGADAAWVAMVDGALYIGDGGEHLEIHELPLNESYPKIASLDGESVFVLGCVDDHYGRRLAVCATADGGDNWGQYHFDFMPSNTMLAGIDVVDSDTAWVVAGRPGADPESGDGFIWKTEDGGGSWGEVGPGFDIRGLASCAAMGGTVLFGGMGFILRATHEGETGPAITSITPNSAAQFTFALDLQVTGTGFRSGAAIRLEKGSSVIDAYNVNVVSGELITCTAGLFGAEPGVYDVVVVNPDGQEARLPGAFTVTSACGTGSGAALLMLGLTLGLLSLAGTANRKRRHRT
jgi:photosystem II stability/assembly factor-like uncharacterized protein